MKDAQILKANFDLLAFFMRLWLSITDLNFYMSRLHKQFLF